MSNVLVDDLALSYPSLTKSQFFRLLPFMLSEVLGPSTSQEAVSELGVRRIIFPYFYSSDDLLFDLGQFAFLTAIQYCCSDVPYPVGQGLPLAS